MKRQFSKPWFSFLTALLLLLITAGGSGAATFNITAEPIDLIMPDGTPVPAWGYRLSTDPSGSATVPGPSLEVPAGDPTLIVNLTNALPEATSLHILGQAMSSPGLPTFAGGRVMSFVKETLPGSTEEYRWDNFQPGTYMLQSATNPAKQVQMGLYAAVVKDVALGEAYPGVTYDDDRILVFHEIDPDMHLAIAGGTYTSSVYRHPRYYLINGNAYPATGLLPAAAGQTILLRFVNAGLETHVPQILGKYMNLVAQDGQRLNYDKHVYGFELNSAASMDALLPLDLTDDGATLPIYDARVKNVSSLGPAGGGMLVKLAVGPAPAP